MSARAIVMVWGVVVLGLGACSQGGKVSPSHAAPNEVTPPPDPTPPDTTTPPDPTPPDTTTPPDPTPPDTTTPPDPTPPDTTTPPDPTPPDTTTPPDPTPALTTAMTGRVRIVFLHHSTGEIIWDGGIKRVVDAWNAAHGTDYVIEQRAYPAGTGGYPWANYPYDYWNLWVSRTGTNRDRGELNLDDLVALYDVIVFKHCFPVSEVVPDSGTASVSSQTRSRQNYVLQYAALKTRLKQFPSHRFLLWTGAAILAGDTETNNRAARAKAFFDWVKTSWDVKGDNIYLFDFFQLETGGGNTLLLQNAQSSSNSHPNTTFAATAAPLAARRIIDVIEGRGDTGSLTGN